MNEITKNKIRNSKYHKNLSGKKNPFYGRKHSDETKKKISLVNSNHICKDYVKQILSIKSTEMWKNPDHKKKARFCHTPEAKLKISESSKQMWKNNKNKLKRLISIGLGGNGIRKEDEPYPAKFNKQLKLHIRERDNHICQNCGMTEEEHLIKYQKPLEVHHINYDKNNCYESNLITVCKHCNLLANGFRDYWFAYYTYIMENWK